jgi:hypothetical protein
LYLFFVWPGHLVVTYHQIYVEMIGACISFYKPHMRSLPSCKVADSSLSLINLKAL